MSSFQSAAQAQSGKYAQQSVGDRDDQAGPRCSAKGRMTGLGFEPAPLRTRPNCPEDVWRQRGPGLSAASSANASLTPGETRLCCILQSRARRMRAASQPTQPTVFATAAREGLVRGALWTHTGGSYEGQADVLHLWRLSSRPWATSSTPTDNTKQRPQTRWCLCCGHTCDSCRSQADVFAN